MNALINLVLAIVLNFLSNGTDHPDVAQLKLNHAVKEVKTKVINWKTLGLII